MPGHGTYMNHHSPEFLNPLRRKYASLITWCLCSTLLAGCGNLQLDWPHITIEAPANTQEQKLQAYEKVTETSHLEQEQDAWFKVYIQAESLTPEERKARLLALSSLLNQSDQNQTHLALEQATLLGVVSAPRKQWKLASKTLAEIPDMPADSNAFLYKTWLGKELKLRLSKSSSIASLRSKNAKQKELIKQLQIQVEGLNKQIKGLNNQIEALTNIEQNLTEKKVSQ